MKPNKSVSVCLVLEDGENKGKAVLQKRSEENKDFSFVCQTTWAGKLEEGEKVESAIKRECKEELGEDFCNNFNFPILIEVSRTSYEMKGQKWESINFKGYVSEKLLTLAKIHKEASGFVLAGKEDLIFPLSSGKNPQNEIILFDDQYKFIKDVLDGN